MICLNTYNLIQQTKRISQEHVNLLWNIPFPRLVSLKIHQNTKNEYALQ